MRNRIRKIHFVGVGGSGMSGIAEVLVNLDYQVSGSDIALSPTVDRLKKAGIRVDIGHNEANVSDCDVVVVSTAIDESNPEVKAALDAGVPVIPRAEMLGELMRFQKGIAIAGTHGKTTTTSLVSAVLIADGMDPTFVVGGQVNSAGANAKLGKGEYLVAEADESDASFLNLKPEMAVVTNIDADHMSTYKGDFSTLKQTFIAFLQNLPFYGLAVLCIDDENVQAIRADIHKPMLTYGVSENADFRAVNIEQKGLFMHFDVLRLNNDKPLHIELALPGKHNVLNALAAIAIANHLEVSDKSIITAFKEFQGIGRRFQILGDIPVNEGKALLVDDYAHHPVELNATLSAATGCWPDRRLIVVFQPHRYSRTHDLFDDFVHVLAEYENLVICDVYPAGEQEVAGASGSDLCRAIRVRGTSEPIFVPHIDELTSVLKPILRADDVIITLGAGSIGKASREFYQDICGGEV